MSDDRLFPDVTEFYERAGDSGTVSIDTTTTLEDDDEVILTSLEPIEHEEQQQPDDPYADAPAWVRAHIPRGPLVIPPRTRGFTRRRQPTSTSTSAPASPPTGSATRMHGKGWLIGGVAVAVLMALSAAVVTVVTDTSEVSALPPLPTPAATATTTAATTVAAPPWCVPVDEPDRIVGNGPGGRDSGPAVIQAFEYAYYTARDGQAVADLMMVPGSDIQSFIDKIPVGTEHCVTVAPTDDPTRWSVDVLLKFPPLGTEGVHQQWITTIAADGGLKIATVEDR